MNTISGLGLIVVFQTGLRIIGVLKCVRGSAEVVHGV